MKSDRQWQLLSQEIPQDLSELQEILLKLRKIEDKAEFFSPAHPMELKTKQFGFSSQVIKKAMDKLFLARERKTPIVIFGDYDADGICAASILWRVMHELGFAVTPFIPSRLKHGYGLNVTSAQAVLTEHGPQLIITVDNGIVAFEAVEWLKEQRVEVIITDHHQPEWDKQGKERLPNAVAVLQTDQVCGAGVAWLVSKMLVDKIGSEFGEKTQREQLLTNQLDLCALATIADQVPLTGFNRSFIFHGLQVLRQTLRPGLLALAAVAGHKVDKVDEGKLGYQLAPRLNALGRLAEGIVGVRLLCTNSRTKAESIAGELNNLNLSRQDLTESALTQAEVQVTEQLSESLLIVYAPNFHEGVIGLVAGRLTEKYHKPAIAIGGEGETLKASARSVVGVNITELIRQVKADLLNVGGHPLAAGFSVHKDNLYIVINKLQELAKTQIDPILLQPKIIAECKLPPSLINIQTAQTLLKFAPFGQGNHQPVFMIEDLELISTQVIGAEGKHLKLALKLSSGQQPQLLTALYWHHAHLQDQLEIGAKFSFIAKLEINTWRDRQSLQLGVIAVASSPVQLT
ncbi:MAG TPA: single-stranded-DNA-specific exonuclease RecJ [Candidatus Woesebacteria bacterium]|nr:single-stranded-DNA-specific exonuclease RecJ [Candidatus Woesebacteria bacterium]